MRIRPRVTAEALDSQLITALTAHRKTGASKRSYLHVWRSTGLGFPGVGRFMFGLREPTVSDLLPIIKMLPKTRGGWSNSSIPPIKIAQLTSK